MTPPDRRPSTPSLLALGLTAGWALLAGAAHAGVASVTYGFDGVSAPGAFHQIAPGFQNGPTITTPKATFEGGVILIDALFGSSATSGDNILATCDTCGLGDGPPPTGLPGLITATFTTPVESVALDVVNGFGGSPGTFTLTAFDADGGVLTSDSVVAAPMGSPGFVQPLAVAGTGIRSVTVTTTLGQGYTFAIDTVVVGFTPGTWTDLGSALAGTAGAPSLVGDSTLLPGDRITLTLTSARPGALAVLVLGLSEIHAPFQGGIFVPSPDELFFVGTNASGGLLISTFWPGGLPGGVELSFQYWIDDPAGPFGWAASNAVRAVTP